MNLFAILAAELAAVTDEELRAYITAGRELAAEIAADPEKFITDERDRAALLDAVTAGVAEIERAAAELASRQPVVDEFAALAARADALEVEEPAAVEPAAEEEPVVDEPAPADEPPAEPDAPVVEEPAPAEPAATEPPVEPEPSTTASVRPAPLARPSRSRAAAPVEAPRVALTAAAEGLGYGLGAPVTTEDDIARMMSTRRGQFGDVPEGTHGEKVPIVRADWRDQYPEERILSDDGIADNWVKIHTVVDEGLIQSAMELRKGEEGLTASGGLCAPVTPYYQLAMLASTDRPVRAALPSFSADRGGIRFATPASIASVTTGVGTMTVAQDAAGGTTSQKSCQVVPCPPFSEVDVVTVYHCIQFGNLGARTFPERVAQWNSLVLAQHARVAETLLLDGIAAASTAVTAASLGFGASAALPSQIITAADAQRSRQRMSPQTVLRCLLPWWVLDLLCSDMYRTQFDRFDMGPADFISLLRQHNVEPTFYLDSPTGGGQAWGAQTAGALLPFPSTIIWFLYAEGQFLYLDGGVLELGLVRDSVLNKTNDFQIFGESFENVAFVGVESLKVTSTTCDNGAVALPKSVVCPISYAGTT